MQWTLPKPAQNLIYLLWSITKFERGGRCDLFIALKAAKLFCCCIYLLDRYLLALSFINTHIYLFTQFDIQAFFSSLDSEKNWYKNISFIEHLERI